MTFEKHRRKGVSSTLLGTLIEDFTAAGGQALYLCTRNPFAGALYEKHGFRVHVGDGMRFLAPGEEEFDRLFFRRNGAAELRLAHWGDLPKVSALQNHHSPRWMIKDDLTNCFRDTRYESHFVNFLNSVEDNRGFCLVLENDLKRIVGFAAVQRRDNVHEQHVATMTLRVVPSYFDQAGEVLDVVAREAAAIGISCLETRTASCDLDHQYLLESAGFTHEASLRERFRIDRGTEDVEVFARTSTKVAPVPRSEADYYGGRKDWQRQRAQVAPPPQTADHGRPLFGAYNLGAEQRETMDREGHLVLPGALLPESREQLVAALARIEVLREDGSIEGHEHSRFAAEYDHYLESLIGHPQMLELARRVLGDDIRFDHCVTLNRHRGTRGSSWHSHGYADDDTSLGFVRIFFYVNGFDIGDGNLQVVPGSHLFRDGTLNASTDDELEATWLKGRVHRGTHEPLQIERLDLPEGSVVLMWTHALHAVEPRKASSDTRWTVVYAYRNPGHPSDARWISPGFERKRIIGAGGLMSLC